MRRRARRRASSPATTPSCTSPPSRTTTTRSRDPSPFLQTNLIGTYTLLEAVRAHDVRYHHISTDEVYGDLELDDPERFTEATPYNPSSPYSATKAGSDLLVRAWVRSLRRAGHDQQLLEQLRAVPARREVHPAPDHERARRRPPEAVRRRRRTCATGSTPTTTAPPCSSILERGRARRDLPHRRRRRARQPAGRRDDPRASSASPADAYDHVNDRAGHDLRYAIDSTKLRTELGWQPRYADFGEGLAATIGWYRANEAWWRPQKAATEAKYARTGQ